MNSTTMIQSPMLLDAHRTNDMTDFMRTIRRDDGLAGATPMAPFLTRRTIHKDAADGLLNDLPRFSAPSMMAKTPTSQQSSTSAVPGFRLSLAPRISHERQQPQDQQQHETSEPSGPGDLLERLRNRRSRELGQQQQQSRQRQSSSALLDRSSHHHQQKSHSHAGMAIGEGKMQERPSGGMARSA
eukprot:CAMPEP_0119560166 /NCGR_PEP_ID=MMETSP1352-20130426/14171_1 /TAXON_ID=265584 /ORGANISM="Stauroneis constricta, Strain CCMP1120" /LENGTH=184 /DNA_ID=CAMNT_0007608085 /DNA_START=21 /DNA_END=575 /DNA_ORIENTATION=-